MNTHVEDLIAYPHRHFKHPHDVLDEPTLSIEEKRLILESWKLDAQRLAESTAENMSGGEESDLRDVSKVLVELKQMEDTPQAIQRSHPSPGVGTGMGIGALVGAGAGLVIIAVTGPSLAVLAQATVVGVILGGVAAALRNAVRN
ncbi:MAG TPA: hypothetical protein VG942_07600 [Hyphomonadaceae bacterium]|nr:hypothetical protein [Hyphomonadaceae bacterium]